MTQFVALRHFVFNNLMGSTFIFDIFFCAQAGPLTFFGEQAGLARAVQHRTGGPSQPKPSKLWEKNSLLLIGTRKLVLDSVPTLLD
jgi:hypothetical protein